MIFGIERERGIDIYTRNVKIKTMKKLRQILKVGYIVKYINRHGNMGHVGRVTKISGDFVSVKTISKLGTAYAGKRERVHRDKIQGYIPNLRFKYFRILE